MYVTGTYCPAGTSMAKPCEAGTYTNISMQESCADCPAGYFCPAGADDITDCPQGDINSHP